MALSVPSGTSGAAGSRSRTPASGPAPAGTRRRGELPSVHNALICVGLPGLAISPEHGQLTGQGFDGYYQSGRRLLSRCHVRVSGREPVAVRGSLIAAGRARFVSVVRLPGAAGPDPELVVERLRSADGTERITLRSASDRVLRVPVEIALGTDLAFLGAVAAGTPGAELPAGVHGAGLRWTGEGCQAVVTADPPPDDALAAAGSLRWELEVPPGGSTDIELRIRTDVSARPARPMAGGVLSQARADSDDPRAQALLRMSLEDLRAMLVRDPSHPADVYPVAGVPWRCGFSPADTLWAARMTLPLGTRLAAAALRGLARTQLGGTGPGAGRIPGPLRDAGPHLPPTCTGVEATLLFPVLLAEARRWGLPEREVAEFLPAAERCLAWLRAAADGESRLGEPGAGGLQRAETQAHAHRAAMLAAELLGECGRPGADAWHEWAHRLRSGFRQTFWIEDRTGGRPAAARTPDGRLVPHLGSGTAHLLDTGLLGGGTFAEGLLDKVRTEQVARLLGGPAMDSGWGLRSLGAREQGHNPFGHRGGAVRVHETALAVAGLAASGFEREAASLLNGVLSAASTFGYRLPEMYAGVQRTEDSVPLPHPAACRPAAVSAAAGIHLLTGLAGVRPDVPAGTVALRPMSTTPLGAIQLSGLSVAGEPFSVRVSRLGLGMVEEAAAGLQLGL
ncbi:glycogen debranching N-terminal domain-containing protein [Streptomyces sp. NBC_00859]|uniref:glycogen debranching N-terminal domain-containing protein n=1 Tax=Streptomyces sp. NBC_00859 TaxID=2903682 RepID=UPI003866A051|nr:glycogen debranching protein [Streptomyces sp. NBC_00859]